MNASTRNASIICTAWAYKSAYNVLTHVPVCLSIRLAVCLPIYLRIYLSIYLHVWLFICLRVNIMCLCPSISHPAAISPDNSSTQAHIIKLQWLPFNYVTVRSPRHRQHRGGYRCVISFIAPNISVTNFPRIHFNIFPPPTSYSACISWKVFQRHDSHFWEAGP